MNIFFQCKTKYLFFFTALCLFWSGELLALSDTWHPLGPSAAHVTVLSQSSQGDQLYAGTTQGVFLSRNQGASWQGFQRGLSDRNIQAMALHEAQQQVFVAAAQGGIFASEWVDGELLWQPFNQALPSKQVQAIAFDAHTHTLYAALSEHGVFKRELDLGVWEPCSLGLEDVSIQHLQVLEGDTLLAVSAFKVFLSKDAGAQWDILSILDTEIKGVQVQNPQNWWLTLSDKLWHTANAGAVWEMLNIPVDQGAVISAFVHPQQPEHVYLSVEKGFLSSEDAGHTWHSLPLQPRNTRVLSWAAHPSTGALYLGTQHLGVFKTDVQAEFWDAARFGLNATDVTALLIYPQDTTLQETTQMYAAVDGLGLLKSQTDGRDWQPHSLGLNGQVHQLIAVPGLADTPVLWAATTLGVFRSMDMGLRWESLLADRVAYQLVSSSTQPAMLYAATDQGVYGIEANAQNMSWQGLGLSDEIVLSLAIDPLLDTLLYAGTMSGKVYQSVDGGQQWQVTETPLNAPIHDLLFVNMDGSTRLLAATEQGLWYRDAQTDWQPSSLNVSVQQLSRNPLQPSQLYAATAKGVFNSRDQGTIWSSINTGLPILPFNEVVFGVTRPQRIYAASQGAGVFVLNVETSTEDTALSSGVFSAKNAEQLNAVPTHYFAALDADIIRQLPETSWSGLRSEQLAYLSAEALSGLSLMQFEQIPDSTLFGLHPGNVPGLSNEILAEILLNKLPSLNQTLLQRLDSTTLSRLLQQWSEGGVSAGDLSLQLPNNWQYDAATQTWSLPEGVFLSWPETTSLSIRPPVPGTGGTSIDNPPSDTNKTASTSFFTDWQTEIEAVLEAKGLQGFGVSRTAEEVLLLSSSDSTHAYLLAPNGLSQGSPQATLDWQLNSRGQVILTTHKHRVTLNPTSQSLQQLQALLGESGKVWRNAQGAVLLYDVSQDIPVYRMFSIASPVIKLAESAAQPGIHPQEDGSFQMVYTDLSAQQARSAIVQPHALLDELYRFGAEWAVYQTEGTCQVQFAGVSYVLRAQANLQVDTLAPEEKRATFLSIHQDSEGLLWLDYGVQWKDLWLSTRLQVETDNRRQPLQSQVWLEHFR